MTREQYLNDLADVIDRLKFYAESRDDIGGKVPELMEQLVEAARDEAKKTDQAA